MEKDIEIAIFVLRAGGTILYPTDTVWGIGCDATNEDAINQVYDLKRREDRKSMIILVDDPKMIINYVDEIPKKALEFIKKDKVPTTIIYPKAKNLPSKLIAQDGSIAIRVARDEFCRELIRKFGKPIVSTSANYSGMEAPGTFRNIDVDLICDVDYVVKWGQQSLISDNKASRLIKLQPDGKYEVIRDY